MALVAAFCDERKQAINRRRELENIWRSARDQYKGYDGSNNPQTRYEKSETLDTSLSSVKKQTDDDRSTVLVNITRPYTNAGTARVADILLPTGKMPWALRATPVSDLQTALGVLIKYPDILQQIQSLLPDVAAKTQDPALAQAAIEKAELIIKDWLKESDWAGVVRRQLVEAGIVGTGVIKGPFPKERPISVDVSKILDVLPLVTDALTAEMLTKELEVMLFYTPQIECTKVENCYPDADCGCDVQNGKFFWEKIPNVTARQLKDLCKDPSYDVATIKQALEEGPQDEESSVKSKSSKKSYCLWLRTGPIEWIDGGEEKSLGFGVCTMLNDRIIKCASFPLEREYFPYHMLCWEPRDNSWAGIGIPEQMETPQRGLTASVRALMDNMGYSVGPQVLELDGLIEPIDGDDTRLRPYKRWRVKSGLPGVDAMSEAKNAMAFLEFPNYLNNIMPVIQYWMDMAERTTGLSLLLQGQAVTDAVGVSQQLMNNATTNLRLIVKEWDDKVCRPLLTNFYEWVQLYGPEEARGDAVVEPLGSTTLIVRELQQQALLQISQQVLQPVYGVSPKKWMETYLEGFQIDMEQLALTEEERQQLEAAAQQPDPKVLAAQVEAQAEVYKADLKKEVDTLKLALEAQFKKLSLEQAQNEAQLKSDTALVQETIKEENSVAVENTTAPRPAKPAEEPVNVDEALSMLGLQ
ncbi:MAG: hypothetical protein IPP10_15660 [Candidatus Competibacteraceae bacterium]|nr:hypothetical protein [Candidatus Competibacteraceae bacterium]